RLAEIRDELRAADAGRDAHVVRALRQAFGVTAEAPPAPAADSLARAYVAALDAGDSAVAAGLRERLGEEIAADEVAALRRHIARLERFRDALEDEAEERCDGDALRSSFALG